MAYVSARSKSSKGGMHKVELLRLPEGPVASGGEEEDVALGEVSAFLELGRETPQPVGFEDYCGLVTVAKQWPQVERELNLASLYELRALLLHGTAQPLGNKMRPFKFPHLEPQYAVAHGAGLEGFLQCEKELVRRHGRAASVAEYGSYCNYLRDLLAPVPWTRPLRSRLYDISRSDRSNEQKYEETIQLVGEYTDVLRRKIVTIDHSRWVREARIYQIFPRAFNLAGWREAQGRPIGSCSGKFFVDFDVHDLENLIEKGFNSIYIIGAFPIGKVHAKGFAGGSPFSIKCHWIVDPAHGTDSDVKNFVLMCNRRGVSVVVDLVLNHSAVDADLVKRRPDCYIYRESQPKDPNGHVFQEETGLWLQHGGYLDNREGQGLVREYWKDTLQFNLWNPDTRRLHIASTNDLLQRYNFNGFRVDMAYQMLNSYFEKNWQCELDTTRYPRPSREFLEELISAVKIEHPGTAFIAEGYDGWQELSEAGFDAIFGLNDMDCNHKHHKGWYKGLMSRSPEQIRQAITRNAFLHCCQTGGADMFTFIGDHDRPAPWRDPESVDGRGGFGQVWVYGATWLTLLKPGPLLFYGGQEGMFDAPCDEDYKAITFKWPVTINWSGVKDEYGGFVNYTLRMYQMIQERLGPGELHFTLLEPEDDVKQQQPWVGYVIHRADDEPPFSKWIAIVANPTDAQVKVECSRPDLGVSFKINLDSCGPHGVEAVCNIL